MKNETIGKVLKELRQQHKLSVKDIVLELERNSLKVAPKTVYGWESSQALPSADTLLLLCEIYNVDDILGTFGYHSNNTFLPTQEEKQFVLQLRNHPEMLPAVQKLLDL